MICQGFLKNFFISWKSIRFPRNNFFIKQLMFAIVFFNFVFCYQLNTNTETIKTPYFFYHFSLPLSLCFVSFPSLLVFIITHSYLFVYWQIAQIGIEFFVYFCINLLLTFVWRLWYNISGRTG